jgi:hypothetical protein
MNIKLRFPARILAGMNELRVLQLPQVICYFLDASKIGRLREEQINPVISAVRLPMNMISSHL